MNKTKLKSYAPAARHDFIRAVTDRAHLLGLSESGIEPVEIKGDVALITGRPYPAKVAAQRKGLEIRIQREGFSPVMEAVAYTWFNRFAALRYMEVHGYLEHGFRVLSHPNGGAVPEILEQAANVTLTGLDRESVIALKLDGNKDAELYRILLVAQCNALATAMPFLFERIDDETELLLPDNLLHSDSLIRKLVSETDDADWQQVEIIGWLYQYYISEKKEEVIGKVVKSEDIPAATQLFTPNWIVQYLVQNSVGRLWLSANSGSVLASQWPYYVQPPGQTAGAQAELTAQIQARVAEDGGILNPETIKVLDPACGSGHILVVAYDVLKAIYLERGYQPRSVPRLILEKNLYGLDIDDRAAQLAAFALLMKARADDRRLLMEPPVLNVRSIQESNTLDANELATRLAQFGIRRAPLTLLVETFECAKTFGSLIRISAGLAGELTALTDGLQEALDSDDLYVQQAAKDVAPLLRQARLLGIQFDAVVANPPYMGNKGLNDSLKSFAKLNYPDSKADIFAMFIERAISMGKRHGSSALVTMQSWMFLSSFEKLRDKLLRDNTLLCLAHFPYENRMPTAMGINFGISAFVIDRCHVENYRAHFCCGRHHELNDDGKPIVFPPANDRLRHLDNNIFERIPGKPISYWINPGLRKAFENGTTLESRYPPKTGMTTGDDARFLRQWFEVGRDGLDTSCESSRAAASSGKKWFPYNKGGVGDRWYGHCNIVANWKNDGAEIKEWVVNNPNDPNTTSWSRRVFNHEFFFRPGLTWTLLNSRTFNVRFLPAGNILNVNGPTISIPSYSECCYVLGFLNSKVAAALVQVINPTAANNPGDVGKLPLLFSKVDEVAKCAHEAIEISRAAWDEYETSFDFRTFSFLRSNTSCLVASDYETWSINVQAKVKELVAIEQKINEIFIDAYGLQGEILPEIAEDQITIAVPNVEKDCQHLISYAMGCMMGRYSLDEPGLVFATAGNVGFDPSRYTSFLADADGILPITSERWFENDAASRVREFLGVVWGAGELEENMAWLSEKLGRKASETSDEAIRRYLAEKYFRDHVQCYKKRPVYWLFSSGRHGAFQALVYVHRYHEATLPRMRSNYVNPLQGKITARITNLQGEVANAPSTAARNKLQKQLDEVRRKQVELAAFDDVLRHHADQRISLDLDDGIKANYAKFGNLLADVKTVTGGSGDE